MLYLKKVIEPQIQSLLFAFFLDFVSIYQSSIPSDSTMTAFTFKEEDVRIPFKHPLAIENKVDVQGIGIIGTLVTPSERCTKDNLKHRQNRVVVLCHGQRGHRNYVYQKVLAHRLATEHGLHVFRFDFRSSGDSQQVDGPNGHTSQAEISDISVVINYLVYEREFVLGAIVAHSRAVQAVFTWALLQQTKANGHFVPAIVNCSGRYRTGMVLEWMNKTLPGWDQGKQKLEFPGKRFGETKTIESPMHEFVTISGYDMDLVKYLRPDSTVLSIHGDLDNIVPYEDAYIYDRHFKERSTLHIIKNADHNYVLVNKDGTPLAKDANGRNMNAVDQVVDIISNYLSVESSNKRFFKLQGKLPTGQPRFIPSVDNVINLRDFGGFPANRWVKGRRQWVKPGLLFRSGRLDNVTKPEQISNLGIKQVYDLRSTVELEGNDVFKGKGIVTTHVPLFSQKAYSPEALARRFQTYAQNGFQKTYSEILEAGAVTWFRDMFLWLRDHPDEGMLFHCSAGKDRTGIFAALLLLILGVDVDTVCHEYELSTIGYGPEREKVLQKVSEGGMGDTAGVQFQNISTVGWRILLSSTYETMLETVELIGRKYGGVEHYLVNAVGLTLEDIETIRRNLLYDGEIVKPDHFGPKL